MVLGRSARRKRAVRSGAQVSFWQWVRKPSATVWRKRGSPRRESWGKMRHRQKSRPGRQNCGQTEFPFAASRLRLLIPQPTADAVGYLLALLRSYLPRFSKADLRPRVGALPYSSPQDPCRYRSGLDGVSPYHGSTYLIFTRDRSSLHFGHSNFNCSNASTTVPATT